MTKRLCALIFFAVAVVLTTEACAHHPAALASDLHGAAPQSSSLYAQALRLDDRLTEAFNAHDLDRLMSLFAPDLEFYHDTGGLQSFAVIKAGFGGLFAQNNGIKRGLIPGTLRVFPIKNYGLLEQGIDPSA